MSTGEALGEGRGQPRDAGALAARVAAVLAQERRRLALWAPVAFSVGIAVYFSLPQEPPAWPLLAAASLVVAGAVMLRAGAGLVPALALLLGVAGFGAAQWRAHAVAAPVLAAPVTALVEGRLRGMSQSAAGLPRLELDSVTIWGVDPPSQPARVRITLRRAAAAEGLFPGDRVSVMADLTPPGGPVAPGAFDFRRTAWFERLGAIGTARGHLVRLPPVPAATLADHVALEVARGRAALSGALRAAMPGPTGAFAAAIVTGDRSGLPVPALAALRDSNLAHLLAISGLHMAIVSGLVFVAVRQLLVMLPGMALRWPVKAMAAIVALVAAAGYLVLSGGAVATQRAFVMAAAALGGVLAGRLAISMRALALAALVVLALGPESLLAVGFQMSFAATLALVAVYEALRHHLSAPPRQGLLGRFARYAAAVVLTSAVAGLATAPYAMWHFNRIAPYGLLANMAAVPMMGLVVAPGLVMAAILAPFGLAEVPIVIADAGIGWILLVADFVAGLPGAVTTIPATGAAPLLAVTVGGLWLCLWRSPLRLAGLAALLLGAALWIAPAARPDVLVAPFGDAVAVRGADGLVPDGAARGRYAVAAWLRADGDGAEPESAAARQAFARQGRWLVATPAPGSIVWLNRAERIPAAEWRDRCHAGALVIVPQARVDAGSTPTCTILDRRTLADGRASAWTTTQRGLVRMPDHAQARPWTMARDRQ